MTCSTFFILEFMTKLADLTAMRESHGRARDYLLLTLCKLLAGRSGTIDPYSLFYAARPSYAKATVPAVTTADDGSPASRAVSGGISADSRLSDGAGEAAATGHRAACERRSCGRRSGRVVCG